MTLIKELIDIPDRVQKGDFVLRLTEGVNQVEQTLGQYVVTPELQSCFDSALIFIRSALQSNSSKASYLHGSFGSGKSHFMAVLNLILKGVPAARGIPELAPVITKHHDWIQGKKFLLVPYHMIGATNMESGILGGYVDYIRRTHPEAPIPGVYLAEKLFEDAQALRSRMGDADFFAALSEGAADSSGWGELEGEWTSDRFEAAVQAAPGSEERSQLISDLVKQFFKSYDIQAERQGEAFVSLDVGLSVLSQHARDLGYDGLILFLDELILWLASRAGNLSFIQQEGQKLSKLVESQIADRPIPVISFVARQRDLRELIGDGIPGAEKLNFSDALKHWEGRFDRITLEDRNLPAIAEKRVLKCKSDAARQELDASYKQATKVRDAVMNILLTSEGDREMFRQVYPFSPALVQTLIAVSSVLQRERTALKLMVQLLVSQRESLALGDIIPVGDLFDEVAHGDEAFSPDMAMHFDNAKSLYHQKLLPMLEKNHGLRREEIEQLPPTDAKRVAFRNDDRLVKTLLLSALVPEVESLRNLNAERLAALNHGTIRSPIPGRESSEVLRRCREWAASVGEIRIGEDHPTNPAISVQLTGIDTDSILEQAAAIDNRGNRIRLVRDLLFDQMQVPDSKDKTSEHLYEFSWRNTKRSCVILFQNIRELPDISIENLDDNRWKLLIDYPFDEGGHNPRSDIAHLSDYLKPRPDGTRTLAWIPSFLSADAEKSLGKLVILEHILTGDRLDEYVANLSPQDRPKAKVILENQRSTLRQQVKTHLDAAYGIIESSTSLDQTHALPVSEQFRSLLSGFELRPPAVANLSDALLNLLDQSLVHEFPAAPEFEADVNRLKNLETVYAVISEAIQSTDGRSPVDRPQRPLIRQIANPLLLGNMELDATHFVLGQDWKNHFLRKRAAAEGTVQVRDFRRWIDEPKAMGLPREVENLVLLSYADQTGQSFYRHGQPYDDASLKHLPDDCELREQALPDEAQWDKALERAKAIFGLDIAAVRKASTVTMLETQIQVQAQALAPACHRYVTQLETAWQRLSLPDGNRLKTAKATDAIVSRLSNVDQSQIIKTLNTAEVATTKAAMNQCLKQANNLASALEKTSWDIFDGLLNLSDNPADSRNARAKAILENLKPALLNDEHAKELGPAIEQAQTDAVQLLTAPPPKPQPEPEPVPPIKPPKPKLPGRTVKKVTDQGDANDLDLKSLEDQVAQLTQNLKTNQQIRFSLSWIIEENSPE